MENKVNCSLIVGHPPPNIRVFVILMQLCVHVECHPINKRNSYLPRRWGTSLFACVGASHGYHGVYRAAQTVLSRCCHVLVTVYAGASQGYVLGISLYPIGRNSS